MSAVTDVMVRALPGVLIAAGIGCAVLAVRPPRPHAVSYWPRLPVLWRTLRDRARLARAGAAAGAGIVVLAVTGWPVMAVAVAAGVVALPPLLAQRDTQTAIARLEGLSSWVRRVADVLASGAGGLESAITSTARTPPEAIATEVSALAVRVRTRGLDPALRVFADEVGDPAADEVVAALILRARAGGRGLLDVLDAKADALAAEVAARRDVEADRAKPRTDTRLVVTITGVVLAGLLLFARDFLAPFSGLLGQLVMAAIVVLMGLACWWMHLLSTPRPRLRLLGAGGRGSR
ncbi:type II secretion system F family protein [Haloechinothrix halophila]|uniref:type II secretion system F family protein n=1 Tax=Haloechinothrix halophila TaxID=1069073 RepID=UPI0005506336|nr:hypothetical protein [Haloechinothrix halophila]